MAYVYRGTQHDTEPTPATPPAPLPASTPGPKPRPRVFDPSKCGTHAGYRQHRRYDIDPCEDCLTANAAYHREWARAKLAAGEDRTPQRGFRPDACGTRAGYERHLRHGVPVCAPCAEASRTRTAERRAVLKAAA